MKTIIVYYSYTGTTKKYVEKMQEILNCDLLEIKPKKDIKVKGFAAYVIGGLKVAKKDAPELQDYHFSAEEYDHIILATPVWAFTFAPAMRSFLEKEKLHGKKISYFMTHMGGPKKAMEKFKEALSGNIVLDGLDVNSKDSEEENLEKIKSWIKKL